jgi:hypothetical protein
MLDSFPARADPARARAAVISWECMVAGDSVAELGLLAMDEEMV